MQLAKKLLNGEESGSESSEFILSDSFEFDEETDSEKQFNVWLTQGWKYRLVIKNSILPVHFLLFCY